MSLELYDNFFSVDHTMNDTARTARITLSFLHKDADVATAVATDLAEMLIENEQRRREAASNKVALVADKALERARDRALELRSRLALVQVILSGQKPLEKGQTRAEVQAEEQHLISLMERAKKVLSEAQKQKHQTDLYLAANARDIGMYFSIVDIRPPPPRPPATGVKLAMWGIALFIVLLPLCAITIAAFDSRLHDSLDVMRLGLPVVGESPGIFRPPSGQPGRSWWSRLSCKMGKTAMSVPVRTTRDQLMRLMDIMRRSLRYWWLVGAVVVVGASLSVVYALRQPQLFESETVLLYQEKMSRSVLQGREVLDSNRKLAGRYREMVMSRTNLAAIVDEFKLFQEVVEDEERGTVAAAEILRTRIKFRDRGAGTFRISYLGDTAAEAQAVAGRLAERLREEDRKIRREQAEQTKTFLEEEKERADGELKTYEIELTQFPDAAPGVRRSHPNRRRQDGCCNCGGTAEEEHAPAGRHSPQRSRTISAAHHASS